MLRGLRVATRCTFRSFDHVSRLPGWDRPLSTSSSRNAPTLSTIQDAHTNVIRPFRAPTRDAENIIREDLQLWPDFYSLDETRQLLSAALWKLDRGDSTRKRRRNSTQAQIVSQHDSGKAPLADLFQGQYGFEPVRPLPPVRPRGFTHAMGLVGSLRRRDTAIPRNPHVPTSPPLIRLP